MDDHDEDVVEVDDLSSIALRRLRASYFSGLDSDKLTEGLELVFGVIGVVGEYSGMERGDPIPESTEWGWRLEEPGPVFPESLRAPLDTITAGPEPLWGVGKLDSSDVDTEDIGEVELIIRSEPTSDFCPGFSWI